MPHCISRLLLVAVLLVTGAAGTNALQPPRPSRQPPAGVIFEKDVTYGRGGEELLTLNLSRPATTNAAPAPVIVLIHGGAWRSGHKAAHDDLTWQFAQRGYVAATIGYRLCPKYQFPAQVEDVKCAVRFLRARAKQYNLDPDRLGAVGFSAGAHLSMMLGVTGKADGLEGAGGWPEQSSAVQAVVSFCGPTDLAATDLSEVSKNLVKDFIGGTPAEKAEAYRRASPVTYARKGAPPLLMFQGTKDPLVPHTQAYRMIDALSAAGAPGRVEILIGAGHGWAGSDLFRTVEETFAFFDEHLKRK